MLGLYCKKYISFESNKLQMFDNIISYGANLSNRGHKAEHYFFL